MSDFVDRQAAIDALDSINCFGWVGDSWKTVCGIIEHAPSAQPETRWISCEKRLPTQEDEYLVCDHNERVFIAKFWTTFGEWSDKDIIAWKERPEPYRKGTEDAV